MLLMLLQTLQQANKGFEDTCTPALVLTLESTQVSACSHGSLVSKGKFDGKYSVLLVSKGKFDGTYSVLLVSNLPTTRYMYM